LRSKLDYRKQEKEKDRIRKAGYMADKKKLR
jgi:hypothetical protein